MFLRKLRVHKDGKEHGYWSLVETIRTADGPRQRTLCYLGELNGSAHARWQKTVEVFNEQGEATQLKLFSCEAEVPEDPNVARVLVKRVRVERTRRFGDCYLGLELWKQLGLAEFFAQHLDVDGADVPWSRVAAILAINRLCAPGSELAIRPLFHQLEKRVKAHVLVAFLGYALQVTLKHLLKRSASEYSPAEALKRLAEIRSVDIVLPTVEGREIWLRRIAKLDEQQQSILHQLKITLPERLEPLRIQKCSENSALA